MDDSRARPTSRDRTEPPGGAAEPDPAPDRDGDGIVDPTDEHHEVTAAEVDQAAALVGRQAEELVEDLIQTELETGTHEESIEEAKRHIVVRVVRVVAGVVVLLLGIALLAAPGPGVLVIALGLGLLAQDVPFARNLLEKVRRRLPQDEDGKLPRSTIVMMVVVGVGAMAISIWFTFFRG